MNAGSSVTLQLSTVLLRILGVSERRHILLRRRPELTHQGEDLRRYLAGAVLVRLADEGSRVVLVLLALQRTGSATVGGFIVAAYVFPHVVAAPWAGRLIDRTARPDRVFGAAAFCFAGALALTALGIGHVVLGAIFLILVAGGCCGPVITGSLTSQLPALVDTAALPRAFGLDSLSYNIAGIVGPAVGAVIAGAFNPAAATYSLAAIAVIGGGVLATLPIGSRVMEPDGEEARVVGILTVFKQRTLGLVTAASSASQIGAGSLPSSPPSSPFGSTTALPRVT